MKYIKIEANENGSHNNQFGGAFPGEGWAVIPDNMILPQSFPFVDVEVLDGIVVSLTPREIPEVVEENISTTELILLTLAEQEERLCLLKLGVDNI